MKAIVIGATGATGSALVQELLQDADFTSVIALVRRNAFPAHPKLIEVVVDFDNLQRYATDIRGDIAYSCLGTTLKTAGSKDAQWNIDVGYQYHFAALARQNDLQTFVLLSSMGADERSRIFYSRMKGTLEKKIEALQFPHLLIFQPGMLDRPATTRTGEKMIIGLLNFFNRLGILKRYKPLPVSELAHIMIGKSKQASMKVERVKVTG